MNNTNDIRYATNYRYGLMHRYGWVPNAPYDYKSEGILSKVMPSFIRNSNNPILNQFLRFVDAQFVNMTMTVEKLAKFKNFMKP